MDWRSSNEFTYEELCRLCASMPRPSRIVLVLCNFLQDSVAYHLDASKVSRRVLASLAWFLSSLQPGALRWWRQLHTTDYTVLFYPIGMKYAILKCFDRSPPHSAVYCLDPLLQEPVYEAVSAKSEYRWRRIWMAVFMDRMSELDVGKIKFVVQTNECSFPFGGL